MPVAVYVTETQPLCAVQLQIKNQKQPVTKHQRSLFAWTKRQKETSKVPKASSQGEYSVPVIVQDLIKEGL